MCLNGFALLMWTVNQIALVIISTTRVASAFICWAAIP